MPHMSPSRTITIRLSDALYRAITRRAKKDKIEFSAAVRTALAEWAGNPKLADLPPRGRPARKTRRPKHA